MMMRSATCTRPTVCGQTCHSTRTHYPDSEPTKLLLFLLNIALSNKYPFYCLVRPTIYCTRSEHANHYTPDAVTVPMTGHLIKHMINSTGFSIVGKRHNFSQPLAIVAQGISHIGSLINRHEQHWFQYCWDRPT